MAARLIERSGEHAGRSHPLNPGVTAIGRDDDNDVVIAADHVSRRHAELRWDGECFLLTDLGSKNGTLLNGRRIEGLEPLRAGDEITLPGRPGVTFTLAIVEETVTLGADGGRPAAGLRIDTHAAAVYVDGGRVAVSAREYRVLVLLWEKTGGLTTKDELASRAWPEYGGAVADYNVEQLISRLRRKLEADPEHPRYLLTVRGLGYRLVKSEE
jgi:FHA domain-containing protein